MSTMARLEADRLVSATDVARRLMANIGSVVHGKDAEIRLVVAALACEGHVLFEDVPGTAKTVLARAIAGSIEGVQFARIQCTPDLQPTENPIEHEGTFPLPEAQLDRFFLRTSLGYPGAEEELQIIRDQVDGHPLKRLRPVVTLAEVKELQTAVRGV